jgi:hypothetical protein
MDAFAIHREALALEQNVQASIAEPCALRRVGVQASAHSSDVLPAQREQFATSKAREYGTQPVLLQGVRRMPASK